MLEKKNVDRNCNECYYADMCPGLSLMVCEHFFPADSDELLEQLSRDSRADFYEDWLAYTAEYRD